MITEKMLTRAYKFTKKTLQKNVCQKGSAMQIVSIDPQTNHLIPISLEQARTSQLPVWIDATNQNQDWVVALASLGLDINEQHIQDTQNPTHPPFYEATEHYEILILRALHVVDGDTTHFCAAFLPITFIVNQHYLVTIHATAYTDFAELREKWLQTCRCQYVHSTLGLMSLLVDWLTDQYLNSRTSFTQQLEYWQQQLLNPDGHFNDWTELLKASSRLRHYRLLTVEPQEEVLDHWIDETASPVDARTEVRLNDILGHFERVRRDAEAIQSDLDNLTQIYFSATNQRTNEIIRVLTIVSVIFLPLNLLAGIYGMNFAQIPGANSPGGFFVLLGLMVLIAGGILWFLRWRRWL